MYSIQECSDPTPPWRPRRGLSLTPSDSWPVAWRMGVLVAERTGLFTLGSEAVAAAEALSARVLVSSRDDSPASATPVSSSASATRPSTEPASSFAT
jgi:hypothetical protein